MKITGTKPYKATDMNVFHQGYLPWNQPYFWLDNIKNFFRNFKYGWQRATRGYSDRDTWNIDMWHSNIMSNMLFYFRDNTHGYPSEIDDKIWSDTLTEMAESFWRSNEENEAFETDVDSMCEYNFDDEGWDKKNKSISRLRLERDKITSAARVVELHKAMALLEKWYFNLWD